MKKSSIKTTKEDIVDYWFSRVNEAGLSVDASEALERCWRCGCEYKLERCHIVPASLGGKDEPSNLVLLCRRCHLENPNISDPDIMWDWIRAYGVPFYGTFWGHIGMREYEFIYHKTFAKDVEDLGIPKTYNINEVIKTIMDEILQETSFHYGHPYLNAATIAGMYRMLLKRLAKRFDRQISIEHASGKPWWYISEGRNTVSY